MTKFDQPELHPRGFPLWVEILLVSALILTPLLMVSLWQYWQDHQTKHSDEASPAKVTQPATKTEEKTDSSTEPKTETPAAIDTEQPTKEEAGKEDAGKEDASVEDTMKKSPTEQESSAPAEK
jgi:predicted negative regulator of RcsB-dependent stress response